MRPEHIRLTPDPSRCGNSGDANDVEAGTAATVETCEYFGSDTILGCLAGTQAVAVRAPGKHSLAPGTPVMLTWNRSAQHFFDDAGAVQTRLP